MNSRRYIKILLALVLLLPIFYYLFADSWVSYGPGKLAPDPPVQKDLKSVGRLSHRGYSINLLADFHGKVRVLSREDYGFGRESELSPMDLVLGWGSMSDESITDRIKIRQFHRLYGWSVRRFPIPRREIETSSANVHLIPADAGVSQQMKRVKRGHLIELRGHLVEVVSPDGWRWKSSLTREDTGAHSCEVIWIERLEIL